jgi:hypothetical protein
MSCVCFEATHFLTHLPSGRGLRDAIMRALACRSRRRVAVISQRFAVEFDRRTVGIAVRVPGGFMFYASDDRFNEMDGRLFRRARAIEGQLKKVAQRYHHERQALKASPSAA